MRITLLDTESSKLTLNYIGAVWKYKLTMQYNSMKDSKLITKFIIQN